MSIFHICCYEVIETIRERIEKLFYKFDIICDLRFSLWDLWMSCRLNSLMMETICLWWHRLYRSGGKMHWWYFLIYIPHDTYLLSWWSIVNIIVVAACLFFTLRKKYCLNLNFYITGKTKVFFGSYTQLYFFLLIDFLSNLSYVKSSYYFLNSIYCLSLHYFSSKLEQFLHVSLDDNPPFGPIYLEIE